MPEPSRRADLTRLQPTPKSADTHAGLWLDRFLPEQLREGEKPQTEQAHPHTRQFQEAAQIGAPQAYQRFYERWQSALQSMLQPTGWVLRTGEAVTRGRLVVGLGAEGVLENAITLHRTYGVPYLPGSALKGLAATYAHQRLKDTAWRRPPLAPKKDATITAHEVMFGSTRSAGYITFYDALYVPGTGHSGRPLTPDVLTVHHPEYYNQGGNTPPADWDSPTPISFITATGTFRVVLAGPEPWLTTAWHMLALALDELGIGGKTAAGYGRMDLDGLAAAQSQLGGSTTPTEVQQTGVVPQAMAAGGQPAQPAAPSLPTVLVMQIQKSQANSLPSLIVQVRALEPTLQILAAQQLIERARSIKIKNLDDKPWFKELLAILDGRSVS